MEKDNYFFKLLFILFILGIFAYMGINDRSHKGKTFWYEVIDKRESLGSHFSIINKGVRRNINIRTKRKDQYPNIRMVILLGILMDGLMPHNAV